MNQPTPQASQQTATGTDLVRFDPLSKFTPPPWLKPLIAALGTENGKPVLMRNRVVKPEQQRWISARVSQLDAILRTDAHEDQLRASSLTKLQSVLGNPAVPETFAEIRAVVYLDVLADIPAWATDAAVMRWIRGEDLFEDDNPVFVPKPAQLIRLANLYIKPLVEERERLKALLSTVDPPQIEESKWVGAYSRGWWWLYHDYVAWAGDKLRDRWSAESAWLRNRIALAHDHKIGWKIEDPAKRSKIDEASKGFVQLYRASSEAAAWVQYFKGLGIEMPLPTIADFIFAPSELPPEQGGADPPAVTLEEMDEVMG